MTTMIQYLRPSDKVIKNLSFKTKHIICLLLGLLLQTELNAQKSISYLDEPIWSSNNDGSFSESLSALNLSSEALEYMDGVEKEVALKLYNKNILLNEKTLEIQHLGEEDILFLRYYYTSTIDEGIEFENSIVSFPIQKIPPYTIEKKRQGKNTSNLPSNDQTSPNSDINEMLSQNYPNPFQTETRITYQLPEAYQSAKIIVSDINGRMLLTFDSLDPNTQSVNIDRTQLSNGIYFYHLIIDNSHISTKKMIVQ